MNAIRLERWALVLVSVVLVIVKLDLPEENALNVHRDTVDQIVKNAHAIREEQCLVGNVNLIVNAR